MSEENVEIVKRARHPRHVRNGAAAKLWVNPGVPRAKLWTRRRSDGSREAPFRTIEDALGRAQELGLQSVHIRLESGIYAERVELSRDTTLAGPELGAVWLEGSVVNYGHELKIRNLGFRGSDSFAVLSLGDNSFTDLRCVAIEGRYERGVYQSGGHLVADWLSVTGTRASSRSETGVGVLLGNGSKSELRNAVLVNNGAQALVVRHRETVAVTENLYVSDTRWHPALESSQELRAMGAIHVGEGGTLFGSDTRVQNSAFCAIFVVGWRSRAHIRDAVVRGTHRVDEAAPYGGGNAIVLSPSGSFELREFSIEEAELCGLAIDSGCSLSAANGWIRRCPIGVSYKDADFPFKDAFENVFFAENGINSQADELPVPEHSLVPPETERGRIPRVRWQDPHRFALRLFDARRVKELFGAEPA